MKDFIIEDAVISEVLPDFTFRVTLTNGHIVLAKSSGRLRKNKIKIIHGDKVTIEIPRCDLNRGRIIKRLT